MLYDNEKAMIFLLKWGANTEEQGGAPFHQTTPLQMAVRMGRCWMVNWLLHYKANIHVRAPFGETLLHDIVKWHEKWMALHLVNKLVKHGAVVDATDYMGWTALHEASQKGNYCVVRALIEKKADVMLQTLDGQTALEIVSAVDTANLSVGNIHGITKTIESLELEIDRLEQVRIKHSCFAFAMGQHKRLGQSSNVLALHPELVRLVLTCNSI